MGRFDFFSPGAAAGSALKRALIEAEVQRRERVMFDLGLQDRARQQARQDMLDARQVEQDRIANERYNTERSDRLMERADTQGQKYLDAELRRNEREEDQRQRSMERADAAATRYQDAELRRQEADEQRNFQHRENEAQRANARAITGMQQGGRGGKTTEGEKKADSFYGRATDALSTINGVESRISGWDLAVPDFLQSDSGQVYSQAKRQFIEAYLRKDSGAAIGKEEYANADRAYFPQINDGPAALKRKREARQKIVDTLKQQAEYERHRDDIESGKMKHISEPTTEGALRKLAREVVRDGSFNDADIDPQDAERLSSDQILDALVQAVRDRRAGK